MKFFTLDPVWYVRSSVSLNLYYLNSGEERLRQADYTSSEEEAETAQEKKLRLAKQYLADLEADGNSMLINL